MTGDSWKPQWPEPTELEDVISRWGEDAAEEESRVVRVGFVPPDPGAIEEGHAHLDLVLVVSEFDLPRGERAGMWDLGALPVPAQTLVFTDEEWSELLSGDSWLAPRLRDETVWVWEREAASSG